MLLYTDACKTQKERKVDKLIPRKALLKVSCYFHKTLLGISFSTIGFFFYGWF